MTDQEIFDSFESSIPHPPAAPGVYFVYVKPTDENGRPCGRENIVYIGSSGNILKRLQGRKHPYRRLCDKGLFAFTKTYVTKNYKETEKRMVEFVMPLLNTHYNG